MTAPATAPTVAMILAAGFGTRMGELTKATPKPLLQAGGRPLIDHALDHCAEAGVTTAVVNLHYLGDQIRSHLTARTDPAVVFSDETDMILDTGGGVVRARPLLGQRPVFVMNSDAVFAGPNPLEQLARAWNPAAMDGLLLMVPRVQAVAYTRPGDFFLQTDTGSDHEPARPVRRGDAATAPYVYTGAQILSPDALQDAPDGAFSLNIIWDRLLASGRLAATVTDGPWVDVGTPMGLAAADALWSDPVPSP